MSPGPMPVVSVAELEGIPEPITACAECGFLGIRPPSAGEGGIPGSADIMSTRHCPRCGHDGLPVELRTRAEYVEFLRELADPRA